MKHSYKTGRWAGTAALALASLSAFLPLPALAWGAQAHQLIAELADAQLSPAAHKGVDQLLALEPDASLESISTWADEHRNPATAPWHYVNFPRDSCHYVAQQDCPDGRCVVAAIERQTHVLESQAPAPQRLLALKYLVHLVGDVHQPLHAGYRDDKGGNQYQVRFDRRGSNLHAVWDSGLLKHLDESHTAIVHRLLARKTFPVTAQWTAQQVAEESCHIVGLRGFYPEREVGLDYVQQFTPVMEMRLSAAGARLAGLLNQVWH